jgi:hypothetical protein
VSRGSWSIAAAIATLFVALHVPLLPTSLEDLDSINFALGVRRFDVAHHQPHPPGYPIYIAAAKAVHVLVPAEGKALSLTSALAGGLAVLAFVVLFRRLDQDSRGQPPLAILGALVASTSPLFWFTANRPLSDVPGLAAAVAIQAVTLSVSTPRGFGIVGLLAGLASGIRSQIAWLTLPLLALAVSGRVRRERGNAAIHAGVGLLAGAFVWAVPLVWFSGGPVAYWYALFSQGAEDLSGVAMLWTTPTVRQLILAAYSTFVAPWAFIPIAVVVLVCATAGAVAMLFRARGALMTLAAAFGPYFLFDILFQETVTTRYALPVVVPVAYLAVNGLALLPRPALAPAAIALAATTAIVSEHALIGYSRVDAPAFRLLADMSTAERAGGSAGSPVLALHRREEFDLRRPIAWVGGRMPPLRSKLPTPPKHEWLELVKYWNTGGTAPVWFIADPLRSDLALVDHGEPEATYRWDFTAHDLIGGIRPNEMDWYILDRPAWYLGEGWAVTPETAGVAREDSRGPSYAPITAWIRRDPEAMTLMVGGRNLSDGGPSARVQFSIGDRVVDEQTVAPGFFLRMLTLPPRTLSGAGAYAPLTISSTAATGDRAVPEVAIEQFDAKPASSIVFGFGEGWLEQEYNPATGKHWRWTTDRATLRVRSERRPLLLTLTGETETFRKPSHIRIRAGGQILDEREVGNTFSVSVGIPAALFDAGETSVTIETNQTYVPAERRWRSRDRRRLGLKIFDCRVTVPS